MCVHRCTTSDRSVAVANDSVGNGREASPLQLLRLSAALSMDLPVERIVGEVARYQKHEGTGPVRLSGESTPWLVS